MSPARLNITSLREKLRFLYQRLIVELLEHFHWSFVPPLLVYLAAGLSGITAIAGAFYVKEYLDLSAAYLAGLAFWAGLPWAFKIPLGHLIDLIWRWKSLLVLVGASMIAVSILIMFLVITRPAFMQGFLPLECWYVASVIIAPCGYVLQDAVADAMSVDAVPRHDASGRELSEQEQKNLHTTMQTLGRVVLMTGLISVSVINIVLFSGIETMAQTAKSAVYSRFFMLAFSIPLISITGVTIAALQLRYRAYRLRRNGVSQSEIQALLERKHAETTINYRYLYGGLVFAGLALIVGLGVSNFAQEIVFAGSMITVLYLMRELLSNIEPEKARAIVGTAIIIFVFRATPVAGSGLTWFEIDRLGFDAQFLSVLGLIASVLTLVGMLVLRPLIASQSIANIVILLTIISVFLALPNIGLYYGVHEWTEPLTNGVVDARFIAIVDTAAESPFGQIAMIPMLAWIAQNAPADLKATFFAVMASFTNLALSCSNLLTKYLNMIFEVTREVRDTETGQIVVPENYDALGMLLITAVAIGFLVPLATVIIVNHSLIKEPREAREV